MRTTWLVVVILLALALARPREANAEPLLVSLEGHAAFALTTPQSELFGPGASLALALRYPLAPELQLGVELRGGMLSNGPIPEDLGLRDPGAGSFELGMLSLRVRPLARIDGSGRRRAHGLFADLAAGGGVTGKDPRPGWSAGLGYAIALGGGFSLAPTVRYLQVVQTDDALSAEDARLLLAGLELSAFDAAARVHLHRPPSVHARAEPPPPPAAKIAKLQPIQDQDSDGLADAQDFCPDQREDQDEFEDSDGCPDLDDDRDGVVDLADRCPGEAEVVNGNEDQDGCPDEGLIVLENDRIVLEGRIVFDFERARVKSKARRVLEAIVKLKQQHPEWTELRIEGHADAQGNPEFNQQISERRARNAMKALVELGIPAAQITAVGYGSTQLRDPGTSDEANQRNRRVEFVVVSRRPAAADAPASRAPASAPPVLEVVPRGPAP